ncbi:MAG: non-homologous end-joining DNA ligase, partial [Candidatus Microthrix parvicella]
MGDSGTAAPSSQTVDVDGRHFKVSNLDKVLYPLTGTTKADLIAYYAAIAPTILPHLAGRGVTLVRHPNGVGEPGFFEKRCPSHRPDWLDTVDDPGDKRGAIAACALDEPAALVWTANLAALELHTHMALGDDLDTPTMLVLDLDPGPDVDLSGCCEVALWLREILVSVDLAGFAKTSGSKGVQLYVPLNTPHDYDHTSSFALAMGQLLAKREPKRVLTEMTKAKRNNKVLVDWSQNSRHKTTITPYSTRARDRPTVSTPISWDEVSAGADGEPLSFDIHDVPDRVEELGDLFADTLTLK